MPLAPVKELDEKAALAALARAREAGHALDGEAPFRAIYERHHRELFAFLARLLRDDALAEDALQETFLRFHRSIERFDAARPLRSWLFEIARNAALDALRRRRKHDRLARQAAGSTGAPEADPVVAEAARREDALRAWSALDSLPDEARALLVQRHGLGMKLSELALSFSCTERTIRNRLREAAALLARSVIEREGKTGEA